MPISLIGLWGNRMSPSHIAGRAAGGTAWASSDQRLSGASIKRRETCHSAARPNWDATASSTWSRYVLQGRRSRFGSFNATDYTYHLFIRRSCGYPTRFGSRHAVTVLGRFTHRKIDGYGSRCFVERSTSIWQPTLTVLASMQQETAPSDKSLVPSAAGDRKDESGRGSQGWKRHSQKTLLRFAACTRDVCYSLLVR